MKISMMKDGAKEKVLPIRHIVALATKSEKRGGGSYVFQPSECGFYMYVSDAGDGQSLYVDVIGNVSEMTRLRDALTEIISQVPKMPESPPTTIEARAAALT